MPCAKPQIPLQLHMWLWAPLPSCDLQIWTLDALQKGGVSSLHLKPVNPILLCFSLTADY